MSTNSECLFVEVSPAKWYYILEDRDAPKDAWSWLDYATAYGHFSTVQQAIYHLHENNANPGGYSTMPYHEHNGKLNDGITKLVTDCDTRRQSGHGFTANGHRSLRPSSRPSLRPSPQMWPQTRRSR